MPDTGTDPLAGLRPGDLLTIQQAADALGVSTNLIRRAIKDGALEATIPGGRDAQRTGRLGYRISPAALRRWFFGGKP